MAHTESIAIFKELLRQISVQELEARIREYQTFVQNPAITDDELKTKLRNLFRANVGKESFSFFLRHDVQTPEWQRFSFFRIRKFEKADYEGLSKMQFLSITKKRDIWSRPKESINYYGRLNRPGESVLYVSNSVVNTINETECKIGECFFLLIYHNVRSMRISQIHTIVDFEEFTKEENTKREILHRFLLSEFSRNAGKANEYVYRSSIAIFEEYFSNPLIDGFAYPSIKSINKFGYNLAFSEFQASKNLEFVGLITCRLHSSSPESLFQIQPINAGFINTDETFSFYMPDSPISEKRFGYFKEVMDSWPFVGLP